MRKLEPLKYLTGSIAVYYVMAACSTSPSSTSNSHAGGSSSGGDASSGSGGSGSGTSGGSSGGSSGSPVPDANADTTQSGSRLKANYFVGGDGSKQFAYFTDSTLNNAQCAFVVASDGTTRCLPVAGSAYASGAYFSDAHCSAALAVVASTCAAPTNAYAYASEACGTLKYAVYPVTGVYNGTFYTGTSASCAPMTTPPPGTGYSLGAETAPSTFQQATVQAM